MSSLAGRGVARESRKRNPDALVLQHRGFRHPCLNPDAWLLPHRGFRHPCLNPDAWLLPHRGFRHPCLNGERSDQHLAISGQLSAISPDAWSCHIEDFGIHASIPMPGSCRIEDFGIHALTGSEAIRGQGERPLHLAGGQKFCVVKHEFIFARSLAGRDPVYFQAYPVFARRPATIRLVGHRHGHNQPKPARCGAGCRAEFRSRHL